MTTHSELFARIGQDVGGLSARLAALEYDSGLRDISSLITVPESWSSSTPTIRLQRMGTVVDVVVSTLGYSGTGTGRQDVLTLPSGFRPIASLWTRTFRDRPAALSSSGALTINDPSGPVDYFTFTFNTRDAAPRRPPATPPDRSTDMDLTTLTDDDLDQLRRDILTEQERRAKVAQLPDQLAALTRDAVAAGCDPEALRAVVDGALTPDQQAALDA